MLQITMKTLACWIAGAVGCWIPVLVLTLPLQAELPADAAALKAKHDTKITEIHLTYANELEKLQKRAMADGNLTAANEIENEIARVAPDPMPATPPAVTPITTEEANPALAPLVGKWLRESDHTLWDFKDTKSGIYAGRTPFTLSYHPDTKKITVLSAKWVNTLTFGLNGDVMNGEADGVRYRLVRVK